VLCIALDEGAVSLASRAVKEIVLRDKVLKLRLNLGDLLLRELELVEGDLGSLKVLEEVELLGHEEDEGATLGIEATSGTTDTVNVLLGIGRRVELNDPVDSGNIETTRGDISTEKDTLVSVAELEESGSALLLLLLTVKIENRHINVVKQLSIELHSSASGQENNDLLLEVLLEESEEEEETLLGRAQHVALIDTSGGCDLGFLMDTDENRGSDGHTSNILHALGLGGGEEHGLTLGGEEADNRAEFNLETDFENTISLIDDEGKEVAVIEFGGVLHVIKEATRGGDKKSDTTSEARCLGTAVGTAHDDTVSEGVITAQLSDDTIDLQAELTSGRNDNDTSTVAHLEFGAEEELNRGDQECKGFTGAGLGSTKDITALLQR